MKVGGSKVADFQEILASCGMGTPGTFCGQFIGYSR
jgi:hypothetical protein